MPNLFQVGIAGLFKGLGVEPRNIMPVVSVPGTYIQSAGIKGLYQPQGGNNIIDATWANTTNHVLLAGDVNTFQILYFLSLYSDHAGEIDLFFGPIGYFPIHVAANTYFVLPIPQQGFTNPVVNQDIFLQNQTGSTISIQIAYSGIIFTDAPE